MIVAIQKDLAGFIQTVRRVRLSSQCPLGFQARTSWGPHVRFRRVQTLVRESSPLVKLRNSEFDSLLVEWSHGSIVDWSR